MKATLEDICWRVKLPSERIVQCAIYSDAEPGFQVRAGSDASDLQQSHRSATLAEARELADAWKQALVRLPGFEEWAVE